MKNKLYINSFGFLLVLIVLIGFTISSLMSYAFFASCLRVLVFPLLLASFFLNNKRKKNTYFILFLGFYLIAEIAFFNLKKYPTFAYYVGTPFYCLSYLSILIFLFKKMHVKWVIRRFRLHLIVMLSFGIYLFVSIYWMLWPETRDFNLTYWTYDVLYNLLFILVLIISFIFYLYRDTKRSLLLFLACLFIVFSELVQVAYYYINNLVILNKLYSIFLTIGYFFVFMFIIYNSEEKGVGRDIGLIED